MAAYGDTERDPARRYARTREFIQLVRRLWSEEEVTFRGDYFQVEASTLAHRPFGAEAGLHPRLYFGGASAAAEQVGALEADVQLFWGEPFDGIATRIARLRELGQSLGRAHPPLEFGLRVTTVVRSTSDEAWRVAEAKVAKMAGDAQRWARLRPRRQHGRGPAPAPGGGRPGGRGGHLPVHRTGPIRRFRCGDHVACGLL